MTKAREDGPNYVHALITGYRNPPAELKREFPDFDAAELARYAKAKGVHLVGHNETGGSASHYDAQLDRAFAYARDHASPSSRLAMSPTRARSSASMPTARRRASGTRASGW